MLKLRTLVTGLVILCASALACSAVAAEEPPAVKVQAQENAGADAATESAAIAKSAVEPTLSGYCPACYLIDRKAIKGKPEFSSKFRGRVYWHSSADRKASFDAQPDKYLPQFDGLCTTALGGSYGNRIPSDPAIFAIVEDKYYLFSSLRAYRAYFENPEQFRIVARSRFERPMLRGFCPVSYQHHGRAVKGEARIAAVYDGRIYYLLDKPMKAKFDATPDRYVPMFAGHDPVSLAKRAKVKGDPRHFTIWQGRTLVFLNEENKNAFEADPANIITKAQEAWNAFSDS